MKDWIIRSLKTFVQTFLGVVVPEVCVLLNGGFPDSWATVWVALAPVVAAALSASFAAVWNIALEKSKTE